MSWVHTPAMNLISKSLNIFLALQVRLKLLHILHRLVLARQQAQWDFDPGSVSRINHGGVTFCRGSERGGVRGAGDGDDLSTPAETY
jgi:hypothetical protein